jgi:hypothetical protein
VEPPDSLSLFGSPQVRESVGRIWTRLARARSTGTASSTVLAIRPPMHLLPDQSAVLDRTNRGSYSDKPRSFKSLCVSPQNGTNSMTGMSGPPAEALRVLESKRLISEDFVGLGLRGISGDAHGVPESASAEWCWAERRSRSRRSRRSSSNPRETDCTAALRLKPFIAGCHTPFGNMDPRRGQSSVCPILELPRMS